MQEYQILQLFVIIQNCYSGFSYDDFKVEVWGRALEGVPYEVAQSRLYDYCRNPANAFPPHPGALIPKGSYVPGAEETRELLREMDEQARLAVPPPWLTDGSVKRPW